jgi:CheY-like chemotaxis protein
MPEYPTILLADDREDDILIIGRAFQKVMPIALQVVRDGANVIAYLKGEPPYSDRAKYPLPDLLLLDLNMPMMDGFTVIRWIRAESGLERLRIIVLTASQSIQDVTLAYKLGASSCMVKPADFEQLVAMSHAIFSYWLISAKPIRSQSVSLNPGHGANQITGSAGNP